MLVLAVEKVGATEQTDNAVGRLGQVNDAHREAAPRASADLFEGVNPAESQKVTAERSISIALT